jgi:glycine cleavage system H protein
MDPEPPKSLAYQRARFTAQLPLGYRYSPTHFWIAPQPGGLWRVGLTKFATRLLGEMVDYGFEAKPGAPVRPGQVVGWLEGFKAISDLYCIAEGEFSGPNPAIEQNPTLINQDPHRAGWLYAVRGQPDSQCVSAEDYARILDETIDRKLREQDAG